MLCRPLKLQPKSSGPFSSHTHHSIHDSHYPHKLQLNSSTCLSPPSLSSGIKYSKKDLSLYLLSFLLQKGAIKVWALRYFCANLGLQTGDPHHLSEKANWVCLTFLFWFIIPMVFSLSLEEVTAPHCCWTCCLHCHFFFL